MCNQIEECKKTTDKLELEKKIDEVIQSSNLSYGDVSSVLDKLKVTYMEKGNNLLNATHIQKVIEIRRFNR